MRMRNKLALLLLLLLVASVLILSELGREPRFGLHEDAGGRFLAMTGRIELEFSEGIEGAKVWQYHIAKGNMMLDGTLSGSSAYLKMKPFVLHSKDVPNGLPAITGRKYYGPYAISPDGTLMMLSISPKPPYLAYATNFVLMETRSKNIVFESGVKNHWYDIADVAWSPDSEMLAVLETEGKRRYGIIGLICLAIGHPIDEYTFYLCMYNRRGELVERSEVASRLIHGAGRVSWVKARSWGSDQDK